MISREAHFLESRLFDTDSSTVVPAVMAALTGRGLLAIRSFDLRSALAAEVACECPHHGTATCTCQFVVLLVYGDAVQPVVLTFHCRDGQTQAQIIRDAATVPDPRLTEQVMAALAASLPLK